MATAVCTLSAFPDLFERFAASVERFESQNTPKIVVTSGRLAIDRPGWSSVVGPDPFIFARNMNIALRWAWEEGGHFLLVNDDVLLTAPIIHALEAVLQANPGVGIAAPMIAGGTGNALQIRGPGQRRDEVVISQQRIPFICVLVRRELVRAIGLMDEGFTGYGGDDTDYCQRAQEKGWTLAITRAVDVRHGLDGELPFSTSFRRVMSAGARTASMANMDRLAEDRRRRRQKHKAPAPEGAGA